MVTDARSDGPSIGLAEAVLDVIDILRGRPASGGDSPDNWERIVGIIAGHDSLPDSEVIAGRAAAKELQRTGVTT